MSTSACSVLPPYTPSSAVPSYSPEPASDERLIEQTPRAKPRVCTGTHTKKSGRDTVVLTDQDPSAPLPTYGRNALISGFVSLEEREKVSEVVLKVKGNMEGMISETGRSVSKTVLDQSYTLWAVQALSDAACPSTVPFSTLLPQMFQDGDARHPLPPSYNTRFSASSGLSVKVIYTLSVIVTRTRGRKLAFLAPKNTTTVIFTYLPRTCPGRPIQPPATSDFLADVKLMPEEWRQITAPGLPRAASALGAVDMHLFIPAVEVFALGDTIPVHVQLAGAVPSLREFLPSPSSSPGDAEPTVQVTLVRQLLLTIAGRRGPSRLTLARATLRSAPPGPGAAAQSPHSASLDWTGALRVDPDVAVGSFDAGVVVVQDFVVLDVLPPAGAKAQFPRLRHSHPIRLVTDSAPDE
ncbi:hypothetical protein DFH07DRAFT_918471 [Mycena maculata]|uniref:Uncharacterized protein n=1 Tax=Mycena maculata TaxID=230809 RepID=A0AAD7JB52_9AGAR|nr:hypothetical protein DFH07DRAFT_918471 [Mycena maculata]